MKSTLSLLIVFALSFGTLIAQDTDVERPDPKNPSNGNMEVPDNWEVRLDNPDEDVMVGKDSDTADIFFVNMTPGWHITTGPRAIFYPPKNTASGTYKVHSKIHLFNPQGRNEAFGVFMGGQNLQKENQTYTYFLLRNSGEYLIKKRAGADTKIVKDWTKTDAMVIYDDTTKSSVANTLSVEVMENEVAFYVNGTKVDTLPKGNLDTNGIVGLRVNHALNLHVEDFGVEM